MRFLISAVVLALFCTVAVQAQKVDLAIATYSKNGRITGVTNLSGLSSCPSKSAMGKVSSVNVEGDKARLELKQDKSSAEVQVPLDRLSTDDRGAIFKHFLSKKVKLRVAGYACDPKEALVAFSVDRIY